MRNILIGAAIALMAVCGSAHAQTNSAIVVSACGTPPVTYTAGQAYPVTQDTNGNVCTGGGGGGGSVVVQPFAPTASWVQGKGAGTDNAAHIIIAAAAGSLKNYIVSMQCSNSSSTTTTITTNDSAASLFIVPGQGGTNIVFAIPIATAAATAFQFTAATGVTTMTCDAQGYTGL